MALLSKHGIVERWIATATWTAESAIRCGGDPAENSQADLCLARDAQGRFYIPGSSLAGAARGFLARRLSASLAEFHNGFESAALTALFGGDIAPSKAAFASLLLTSESVASLSGVPVVRDYVALVPETGLAKDKGKFDGEVLPAGAKFPLSFELALPAQIPGANTRAEILQLFRWLLESFSGPTRLGGASRAGLGQGKTGAWTIHHYDLHNRVHAAAWLTGNPQLAARQTFDSLGPKPLPEPPHQISIRAKFRLTGPVLIRGREVLRDGPEFVHFREANAFWITGSSLKGVLRQRCRRIAAILFPSEAAAIIKTLFGTANDPDLPPSAGQVWLSESKLINGDCETKQSRVALDRFTGGALDTALFDEAPFHPDPRATHHWETEIRVDFDPSSQRRLLYMFLQAFKDLCLEDLPVGGEIGVGRGRSRLTECTMHLSGYPILGIKATATGSNVELSGWDASWASLTTLPIN